MRATLRGWWPVLGLIAITVAVYAPVVSFNFVNFDDPLYTYQSPLVQPGLTPASIWRAFTQYETSNYHPLTWLSLMLDRTLFGMHPGWFHGINVLQHVLSTLLLYQFLKEATEQTDRSALVAALFAIHPLHVESVAWIAERKDTLSGLFWVLTLWCYGRYARSTSSRWYLATCGAMFLGLLSKQMLVTLPCVLLLCDVWPLKRWGPHEADPSEGSCWSRLGLLIREKLPLFALSVVFSVIAFNAQRSGHSVQALSTLPLSRRFPTVIVSYWQYVSRTIWPANLSPFYPYPYNEWPRPAVAACAVVLITITLICLWQWRRPVLAVGWLWYVGTLLPVIGLVQIGGQCMADRYTYLPLIGLFLIFAWGVPWESLRVPPRILFAAGLILIAGLSIRAHLQVWIWKDSRALFTHARRITPSSVAFNNLGLALREAGETSDAEAHFREAIRMQPENTSAVNNLAVTLQQQGAYEEAGTYYQEALRQNPNYEPALTGYGDQCRVLGQLADAEALLRKALEINPDSDAAHSSLGALLDQQGQDQEALQHLETSVRLRKNNPPALASLGAFHQKRQQFQKSARYYGLTLRYDPQSFDSRMGLGSALVAQGQHAAAVEQFRQAVELRPLDADARFHLASSLFGLKRFDEASQELNAVLQRAPNHPRAKALRAAILQVHRDAAP